MSINSTNATMSSNNTHTGCSLTWEAGTEAVRKGKIAAFSLVLIVSLVGNILVILVVYKNKNMRKTINYFIVNMAASDIIIPVLVIPMQIVRNARHDSGSWAVEGEAGEALCKIVYFLSDISGPVSILSLVCMAVDRFVGVVFPLRAGLISSRVRIGMIVMTWVIALGFYTPYLYVLRLIRSKRDDQLYCVMRWSDDDIQHTKSHQVYITVGSVIFFIVPLILLVFLYAVILITLAKRKFPRLHQQSTEAKRRNRRVSRSATVIAITIVLVFQLCWGPYNTIVFLWAFKWNWRYPDFCGFNTIFFICQFLTWANAAINPCIYFVLVENYRKGLRTVIPGTLSFNGSLKGQRSTKQETQEGGDCLELVNQ